ncbi:MAG: hypothetical protein KGO96_12780 [Elusimicrobia bacterium]|nr:hypothetical protein [Elusimicrobiota bacterium]
MGHENGGWMNSDQRDAVKDEAESLQRQHWRRHPGAASDVMDGAKAGERLAKFGAIARPLDLLGMPVGSVVRTGVSAYERID